MYQLHYKPKLLTIAWIIFSVVTMQSTYAEGNHHVVEMLNSVTKDADVETSKYHGWHDRIPHSNVFVPPILEIQPGDSVTFKAADPSHNAVAKRGMIPEGAKLWESEIGKDYTITLTKEGIYGYYCMPHYTHGKVGLIIVRKDPKTPITNLDKAKKVRHVGKAKRVYRELFKMVEEVEQANHLKAPE